MDPQDIDRLHRGAEALHELGPRAIAEFINQVAEDGLYPEVVLDLLEQYRRRLTPQMLKQLGVYHFPCRLREVPNE